MTKSYLSPDQQLRAQQVYTTHKHLKELSMATKEALIYHDKYIAAMEKVISCLLNNSDTMEDARKHLAQEAAVDIQPTSPTAGRLAAAYSNWRVSAELHMMRTELEFLKEVSTTGREAVKKTKNAVHGLEKVAKKCAHVNSPEFEAKISNKSAKALEKLLHEQRETNTMMMSMENAIKNDMMSLATSWSAKLVTRAGYVLPPPSSASTSASYSGGNAVGYGTPSAYPAAQGAECAAVPLGSAGEGAAEGVTLEFNLNEGKPVSRALGNTAAEAINYHDKFVATVDKGARRLFGTRGAAAVASTCATTGRLSSVFTAWKNSAERHHSREYNPSASDRSTVVKRNVKRKEKTSVNLEATVKRCARLNLTVDCGRFSTFKASSGSSRASSTSAADGYSVRLHLLQLRSIYRSSSSGHNSLHGGFHYITFTSSS
ncbi:hypothetical protein CGC21_11920 [Leishmania donovani]|uniref:Uncharacterized protein n=1 Tax=Leishmania donovani TaxID=5661 RepID=A0A504X6F4_LEIDO|nr:hypothetical protein CGC21_11920 [Leishmania donovani]